MNTTIIIVIVIVIIIIIWLVTKGDITLNGIDLINANTKNYIEYVKVDDLNGFVSYYDHRNKQYSQSSIAPYHQQIYTMEVSHDQGFINTIQYQNFIKQMRNLGY